jgi:4-amino-4-deoxy-L-arabinose transferase-like glycosyltransferase
MSSDKPHTSGVWSLAALVLALALYFVVGLTNLRLPGLQYDEAADAVPAIQVLNGAEPSAIQNITLLGRQWPLMLLHHIGPTSIYTSLIGLSLLGVSVEALRITQLVVGALSLVLLWLLARSWFDDLTAVVAVLLCASAPAFIWWSRAGANWTVPLLPLSLGMLLSLGRWWRTGSRVALIAAALCFGLGLTTKVLFVWWVAPLALTALIAGPRRVLNAIRNTGTIGFALAVVGMLIGLAPLIIHNIPNGDTFRFIFSNAAQTRIYGHNNLDVANNLGLVLSEWLRMLGGDTLHFFAPAGLPLGAIAFVAALAFEVGLLITRPAARAPRRWLLVLTPLTVLPLSTISTSSIGATYVFLIVPLAWLLIAVALVDAARLVRARTSLVTASAVMGVAALALVGNHVLINARMHQFFVATGGRGFWSDSVYALADDLSARFAGRPVIAMDWGFRRTLEFLTRDQIRPREMFEYAPAPSPKFEDVSTVLLRDPQNVYLFHAPETTAFHSHWEMFERAALKSHKQLVREATLTERDGATNTLIYTARPAPRTFDAPSALDARNAVFASGVTLLGGNVAYDPDRREVAVMLRWRADADALPDDTVLLHIVNQSTGEVVMTGDTKPVYGNYPFPQWQKGEVVIDPHWVTLPGALPAGVYQVRIGAYDANGQRRAISDPQNDAAGDSLMLATFEVK